MRHLILLLLLPLLAACPTLPRPFMHEYAGDNPLLQPLGLRGIHVPPVEQYELGDALAEALVKAFEQNEIAATTRPPGPGNLILEARSVQPKGSQFLVRWAVWDQDPETGEIRDLAGYDQTVSASLWRSASGQSLNAIAREAVAGLGRQLREEVRQEDPKAMPNVTLTLTEVPGDGPRSLRRAMVTALRREGIAVVEQGAAIVEGRVTLHDVEEMDLEQVRIAWVVKTPAGEELGIIEQQNKIPKGKLSGPWGAEAYYIAEGGAMGVADLLSRVKPKLKSQGS
jgi:hypothetical protein